MKELGFASPDEIGSSEYRAIYDCVEAGLEDCSAEEHRQLAESMLEEFIGHAAAMLVSLHANGCGHRIAHPLPGVSAGKVSDDAARQIVAAIREYMFAKDGRWQWREISGADFIEFVTLLLSQHGLVPEMDDA